MGRRPTFPIRRQTIQLATSTFTHFQLTRSIIYTFIGPEAQKLNNKYRNLNESAWIPVKDATLNHSWKV